MSEPQEDSTADSGPITSEEEAEEYRKMIEAAEAEYAEGSERPEAATSLIASAQHKLAQWDAQQQGEAPESAESDQA